jgi:predicted ester cyclase
MTPDENKAILRRYIEQLNQRNERILDELVAPDFRQEVRQGYQRNISAFPDYRVEIEDMIAEGDQVVLEWSHQGTQLASTMASRPAGR